MTYQEAVRYISDVPKFTKKNDAGNTRELLRRLGSPQEDFRAVHVAGTNGKGSVCAFLAQILQESGCRTGLFTSPHLVRINERFRIDGEDVSDEEFTDAFGLVKSAIDSMVSDGFAHPTYFEILFAMGCVIFSRVKTAYAVLETGLGGRLDATNTIDHPSVCVITSISLDHTEYLGSTVEEIAGEKAGIIKEGVPVVYDASDPAAARVIRQRAAQMHARAAAYEPGMTRIVRRTPEGITCVLDNSLFSDMEIKVPFPADYQAANCALALMAARVLDPDRRITDAAMLKAVAGTRWAGRMEMVLPGVILDGAHNAGGISALLETVKEAGKEHPVSLLFAAVADKDYRKMIREICLEGGFGMITVTQIAGSRMAPAEEFAGIFRQYTDAAVTVKEDVREAFEYALSVKPADGVLFCAGSLYLVGEIKALLKTGVD